MNLFLELQEIHRRPEPFERSTASDLWTDEHTSGRMLAFHLDGAVDISSRRSEFIDRSAAWIISRFCLDAGRSVGDFGCGPGLYATRLARSGAQVTGIDFSGRSLEYARALAREEGLSIEYVHADYLQFRSDRRFDLVTLIMCDYCALAPTQRRTLLDVFRRHLKPGGAVLLDVYSLPAFEARAEQATWASLLDDGFWSSRPYFGFRNTFKYEPERVVLDKYTIVEEAHVRVVCNWLQHFSVETLTSELEANGFVIDAVLRDVAGGRFDPAAPEFAVVARTR
jgi:SAM-dependent methyltransferase